MPSLLLPIMTCLFLVFTGILIGYVLWFRDRTEEEMLAQNLNKENSQLSSELSTFQLRNAELDEHLSKQKGKLQILQELCDDLVSGRETSNQEKMELQAELRSSRQLLDESREQLNLENRRRSEIEDVVHSLKQNHLESVGVLESTWREKHASAESYSSQRELEIERLTAEQARTADKLHQAESRIAELKSEIENQRELLSTASHNATGLEKEYVSLESSMRSQLELLNESRGQAAAALSAKELAEESLNGMRTQLTTQQDRVQKLEKLLGESEGIKEKCLSLNHALENNKQRLVEISAERNNAMQAEKSAIEIIAGLRTQNESYTFSVAKLNEERDDLSKKLKETTAELQQTQTAINEMTQKISGLRTQTENQERTIQGLREKESQFAQERSRLEESIRLAETQFTQERVTFEETLRLAETEKLQFTELQTSWTQSEEAMSARIRQLQKTIDETEANLVNNEKELSQAEQRVLDLEQHYEQLESVSAEYQVRMEHLVNQRDSALTENKSLLEDLERMRMHSKSNEETIRNLRRERGQVLLRGRQMFVESPVMMQAPRIYDPEPVATEANTTEETESGKMNAEYGGSVRLDAVRGVVYTEAPDVVDDLKLISGIAHVLERRLNEYGIYTYKQVMEWNQTAIDEFSQLLTFRDRIERDDWQGQARHLYKHKYQKKAA